MRERNILLALLCALFCVLLAAACGKVDFKYTVDFVVDGKRVASVGTDSQTIAMPKNPKKLGYVFDGWYWDDGEWEDEFTLASLAEQPITESNRFSVYAKWKSAIYYTVKFSDGRGGTVEQQIPTDVPTKLLKNTFTPSDDERVFDCWIADEVKYEDEEEVLNLCETGESITLCAQWKRGTYTIRFNANGGSGTMAAKEVERGDLISEHELTCTFVPPTGKVLAGWNTKADGSGTKISGYDYGVNLAESGGAVTLYAQWKYSQFTVYYDGNGGEGEMDPTTVHHDGYEYASGNQFISPSNYLTFDCWNTKADGTGIKVEAYRDLDDITLEASVTLYAQWKMNSYVTVVEIHTVDDFSKMTGETYDKVFSLQKDIDCKGANRSPLFTEDAPFNGAFLGNGHVISNFTMTSANGNESGGLFRSNSFFGKIGYSGEINGLGLENFTIEGTSAAAFSTSNDGRIRNCYATGTVIGKDYGNSVAVTMAGICSFNWREVTNCYFAGKLQASIAAGDLHCAGVVLSSSGSKVRGCFFAGTVDIEESNGKTSNFSVIAGGEVSSSGYLETASIKVDGVALSTWNLTGGARVSVSKANTASFYKSELGWSDKIWEFTSLNAQSGKFPKLKRN